MTRPGSDFRPPISRDIFSFSDQSKKTKFFSLYTSQNRGRNMSHVTAASFPKSTLLKHPLNEDLLSFMHSPPSAGTRPPPPRLPPPPHTRRPRRACRRRHRRWRPPLRVLWRDGVAHHSLWTQHRAANPERLHQPDGRNAVAFRRETLDRPRRAGPPAAGRRSRQAALHRRRVASVGLHHGDGLVKPCWYRVSVTLRPLGLAEIRFWPRATRILKVPVRPSESSGVVAGSPQ